MAKEGHPISVAKACDLAGLPRRTFYYQSRRRQRRINEALAARVKRVILVDAKLADVKRFMRDEKVNVTETIELVLGIEL